MPATRLLSAMVATWNNVATTFTGLKLNVTDTASASGSLLMDLQVNSSAKFGVNKFGGINAYGNLALFSNAGSVFFGTGLDLVITRDAANTLALRNGTAAQKLSVYNTYTDASNYERGVFDWAGTANTLRIGTEAAGTGTVRNIQLVAGSNSVTATVGASNLLTLNGGLTTGGNLTAANHVIAGQTYSFKIAGWGSLSAKADGIWGFGNNAGTNFTRLILGTNDASGVAIKKSGTTINLVLGDDSGRANLTAGIIQTTNSTVAGLPSAAGAGTGARSFVTDANTTKALGDGTIVVGGGANAVPVYSDGTNWLIG